MEHAKNIVFVEGKSWVGDEGRLGIARVGQLDNTADGTRDGVVAIQSSGSVNGCE